MALSVEHKLERPLVINLNFSQAVWFGKAAVNVDLDECPDGVMLLYTENYELGSFVNKGPVDI
ncbi:MAG: hypothetical protein HC869_13605 [Rhodospirillales bacterium]|nr:hypothetical protein [Rhodospirillales bacterium]